VREWSFCGGRRWWRQEEGWVMPSKNVREISSLRLASVLRFATNNIDIYGMPRVEFTII